MEIDALRTGTSTRDSIDPATGRSPITPRSKGRPNAQQPLLLLWRSRTSVGIVPEKRVKSVLSVKVHAIEVQSENDPERGPADSDDGKSGKARAHRVVTTPINRSTPVANEDTNVTRSLQISSLNLALTEQFVLPITLLIQDRRVQLTAMLDSGATFNFIHSSGSALRTAVLSTRACWHVTQSLPMITGPQRETLSFYVTSLGSHENILGTPWLHEHNPQSDWTARTVEFVSASCPSTCLLPLPSRPRNFDTRSKGYSPAREPSVAPSLAALATNPTSVPLHQVCSLLPVVAEATPQPIPQEYADFAKVFSKKEADKLPEHTAYDHSIPLMPGTTPPFGRLYQPLERELKSMGEYLEEKLAKGFIRPSQSLAAAPTLFVQKKNQSLRLCVDYRQLNNMTVKNRYPLPLIQESLDRLRSAKIFTKIDLRGAYNLIRIAKGEEWKTAFRTRYGLFEYLVMPFGPTNAPASFQAMINDVL
ncbi:hypothetical protein NCC49_004831 [Naganishia albida]|nr:hypothetical protein NCC49_004831 [Naganishia albida]